MPNEILRKIIDYTLPEANYFFKTHHNSKLRYECRNLGYFYHEDVDISILFVTKAIGQVTQAIILERVASVYRHRLMKGAHSRETLLVKLSDTRAWPCALPGEGTLPWNTQAPETMWWNVYAISANAKECTLTELAD
jgi:hypothetical protein